MKVYDRQKKKWVDEETVKSGSLKSRVLCKGKRPHNFILTLPDYMRSFSRELTPDEAEKFYIIEEETKEFLTSQAKKLADLGIRNTGYIGRVIRYYRCDVCGKKDYKHPEKD
jgi:hypothetical protein